MSEKMIPSEGKKGKVQPPQNKPPDKKPDEGPGPANPIADLQQQVGNRAVQRLIAQRQSGQAETDEATASEISQMRGSGQSLDTSVQREMGGKMGADFSGVNVHTSPQADDLNQRLGARAFTTGQDIFFRQGEYDPNSSGGKELLAHELTHVVQQGKAGDQEPAAKMVVNPPDDVYEREADAVAKQVTGPAPVQAQDEREEEVQASRLQRQDQREDELLQGKLQRREDEEEELAQGKLQRREDEEEELAQGKLQRQEEEEELAMPKAIQRQELEEEELLQGKLQRQAEDEEEEEEMPQAKLQRQELEEEELMQGKLQRQDVEAREDQA